MKNSSITSIVLLSISGLSLYLLQKINKKKRNNNKNNNNKNNELFENSEWKKHMKIATNIALNAGHIITNAIHLNKDISFKGDIDLVTETDRKVEEYIFGELKISFPETGFIGEETTADQCDGQIPKPDPNKDTWVVDPIDGTTNFVHTFPQICISIAIYSNNQVQLGLIYNPLTNELFQAIRGHGAYLNGQQIHVSNKNDTLPKAIIDVEYGYDRTENGIARIMKATNGLMKGGIQAIRQLGSGALSLCYVASGRIDGVYAGVAGEAWKPWDYAGGSIIAEEAGAILTNMDNQDEAFDIFGNGVICISNHNLRNEVLNILNNL